MKKRINSIKGPHGEPLGGVIDALQTPTDVEGRLLEDALRRNLEWLKGTNISGLMVLGSSGEFLKLSPKVQARTLEFVAEANGGDFPLVANCTANTVSGVAELARCAQANGYGGVAIMPQFFYPQTQEDMLEFFLRCAEKYELPTMLYNFPERTGNRIGVGVVEGFARGAKMFGMKQSGAEFEYNKELVKMGRDLGFVVFSGADTRIPKLLGYGCAGCVGGFANIIPEYMALQYSIIKNGENGDLQEISKRVKLAGEIIDSVTFPANLVYGMRARGVEAGEQKMPVSKKTEETGADVIRRLGALLKEWGLEKPY